MLVWHGIKSGQVNVRLSQLLWHLIKSPTVPMYSEDIVEVKIWYLSPEMSPLIPEPNGYKWLVYFFSMKTSDVGT